MDEDGSSHRIGLILDWLANGAIFGKRHPGCFLRGRGTPPLHPEVRIMMIEPLDQRRLLAATGGSVTLANGILTVAGTAGNDVIEVAIVRDAADVQFVQITENAAAVAFPLADIRQVNVFAGAGNDAVRVDPSVALNTVLHGGNGNDSLSGGAGDDLLLGDNGKDVLAGNDGNDTLLGGNGKDSVDGGAGENLVDGERGKDTPTAPSPVAKDHHDEDDDDKKGKGKAKGGHAEDHGKKDHGHEKHAKAGDKHRGK
jgi:hypothetical protein